MQIFTQIQCRLASSPKMRLSSFFIALMTIHVNCEKVPDAFYSESPILERYDFVIVGAGPAGTVLANRLSEVPTWKILLIEAGKPPHATTEIPALAGLMFFTEHNWNYYMEKDDSVGLGLMDQSMAWPRGKGLGGSSLINYMIHTRGNRLDYDKWAALGNPNWSYDRVLPYFRKSENFKARNGDSGYHSSNGLLDVEDVNYRTESAHVFVNACQNLGLEYVDYNGRRQSGVSYVQGTLRNGRRCSGEKAFLRPAAERPNLKVLTEARVTKVLIDPASKEAYGVEYFHKGEFKKVGAEKEVVLTAGAFHSPQLLMLSGIGPADHLGSLGIKVTKDLPVGRKMYDHLCYLALVVTVNESITVDLLDNYKPESYLRFIEKGEGPLTVLGGVVEALAYIKTNVSCDFEIDYPDVELIFISAGFHSDGGLGLKTSFRVSDEVYKAVYGPLEGRPAFQIWPMLVHPESYGKVELRSADPLDSPKLYGGYFTDPENRDVKTFIASIRFVRKLLTTPAMQKYGARLVETPIPGCEWFESDSDDYWECALRHVSVTVHHQVATCKMGPEEDPEAVVDQDLRVYGVGKLRVADTSVIPIPLTAHTNVPSFMIGEKAADILKEYYHTAGY